ncbi:MAG: hypothetical protein ABI402_10930 [Ferruginibacter sp.]
MMKKIIPAALVFFIFACTNQPGSNATKDRTATANKKTEDNESSNGTGCGNFIMFKQGTVVSSATYNGEGKLTNKQTSLVKKVYSEGATTVSEMEMKSTDDKGANEKTSSAIYKCDGKKFYVDLSNYLSDGKQKSKIETSGMDFPYNPSVGDVLPEVSYSVNVSIAGKDMTLRSRITERKVEAKESVTTAAGTFQCYRVSSVIEAGRDMSGMDEKQKELMEKVQKQMGKSKMIFWYAPDVAIVKMEYYIAGKVAVRHEITGIKK